ncbi:hypothetical protein [Endozoicomonas lisbonensis]|uniref:Uncharacterized protein n=1 Tax=Endozoicomonas lisbonensis TaxID=3120522 RepID=A0ABV2SH73_9GAMM
MKKTIVAIATVLFASVSQASISAWSSNQDLNVKAEPNTLVQAFSTNGKLLAEAETNQYGRARLKVGNSQLLSLVADEKTVVYRHTTRSDIAK